MSHCYYIENLNRYIKNIKKDGDNLPVPLGENIIEIESQEQLNKLIEAIRKTEYLEDTVFHQNIKLNFPEFLKYIKKTPIDLAKFKENINNIFFEIPEEYFEDTNTIRALKNILNFVIIKNEISFTVTNILNGKLEYDEKKYRYKKPYKFYFKIMKLNHDLPEYFSYITNSQTLMEKFFLMDLFFSDRKEIKKKDLDMLRSTHNLIGKNLVKFRDFLIQLRKEIYDERRHIKYTNALVPKNYWSEETRIVSLIDELTKATETEIQKTIYRKEELIKYIQEKGGILTKDNLRLLLDILGIGGWFF